VPKEKPEQGGSGIGAKKLDRAEFSARNAFSANWRNKSGLIGKSDMSGKKKGERGGFRIGQ